MSRAFSITIKWGLGLFLAFIVLSITFPTLIFLGITVFFGWVSFLQRTLPHVSINWSAVVSGIILSVCVFIGIHSFGSWLCSQKKRDSRFSSKLTLKLFTAAWLLFASILAAVGFTRQTQWLLNEDKPWFIAARGNYLRSIKAEHIFKDLWTETTLDSTRLRQQILSKPEGAELLEKERMLLITNKTGAVTDVVLIARNSLDRLVVHINANERGASLKHPSELPFPLPELQR